MRKAQIRSNIWKFTVLLIANKRTYMSVLGVYLLTLPEATPQTLGLLLLIGNFTGFIFEVPSGYISDKIGHRNALILSRLALVISTSLYLIGSHVSIFIAGAAFMNISLALYSGTGKAFMHETLEALGRDKEYSKIMGKLSSIGFAVPIIFIILLPLFVPISFKIPFAIALILDIIGLITAFFLVQPKKTQKQIQEISSQKFYQVFREGYESGIYKYLLFSAFTTGTLIAVSGFRDVYQAALDVPIVWYGVFWATSRAIISPLLLLNGWVKRHLTLHQFLFGKYIITAALIIGLGLVIHPSMAVLLFIAISAFNFSFVESQTHYFMDIIGTSNFKATILSLGELVKYVAIGGVGMVLGTIITSLDYDTGFLLLGISFFAVFTTFYFWIVYVAKRRRA